MWPEKGGFSNGRRNLGNSPVDMIVYPIIYKGFVDPRWLGMGFLDHQQISTVLGER